MLNFFYWLNQIFFYSETSSFWQYLAPKTFDSEITWFWNWLDFENNLTIDLTL